METTTKTTTKKAMETHRTLTHGMQIRRTDDQYSPVIRVGTVAGMVRAEFNQSGEAFCYTDEPKASWMESNLDKAIESRETVTRERGHDLYWANLQAACLTSDYPGKDAEMKKKREDYESAPIVEDGEIVILEGRLVKVQYNNPNCSDCIVFHEVEVHEDPTTTLDLSKGKMVEVEMDKSGCIPSTEPIPVMSLATTNGRKEDPVTRRVVRNYRMDEQTISDLETVKLLLQELYVNDIICNSIDRTSDNAVSAFYAHMLMLDHIDDVLRTQGK